MQKYRQREAEKLGVLTRENIRLNKVIIEARRFCASVNVFVKNCSFIPSPYPTHIGKIKEYRSHQHISDPKVRQLHERELNNECQKRYSKRQRHNIENLVKHNQFLRIHVLKKIEAAKRLAAARILLSIRVNGLMEFPIKIVE